MARQGSLKLGCGLASKPAKVRLGLVSRMCTFSRASRRAAGYLALDDVRTEWMEWITRNRVVS